MPKYERFEKAIQGHFFPVCVFGTPEMIDFVLLDLAEGELSETMQRELQARKLFIGVVAIDSKGVPKTALNVPLEPNAITTLTGAYLQHVKNSIEAFAAKYSNAPRPVANA